MNAALTPYPMAAAGQFVLWERQGERKVPLDFDGNRCNANDADSWMGLPEVMGARETRVRGADGIGFAPRGSGIVCFDLDDSVRPDRTLEPHAEAFVRRFKTRAEYSPSGTGLHVYGLADVTQNRRLPNIEIIAASSYFTLTGDVYGDVTDLLDVRAPLRSLQSQLQPKQAATLRIRGRPAEAIAKPSRSAVEYVLSRLRTKPRARALFAGDWGDYPSQSEADAALMAFACHCGGDIPVMVAILRHSGLWRPKLRRDDYVLRTALFVVSTRNRGASPDRQAWRGFTASETHSASRAELCSAVGNAREQLSLPENKRHLAPTLDVLAQTIADRIQDGETADSEGFWTVPAAALTNHGQSRMTAWRHVQQAASLGCFELTKGKEYRSWTENGRGRSGLVSVSRIRLRSGIDYPSILRGFTEGTRTVYVVTPSHEYQDDDSLPTAA